MARNEEKIIKYTMMPRNDEDDYSQNFKLSIREFAKSLEDKTLVAPLIIYNSDLDIPLDMEQEIEKYCFYTDKDGLEALIKKQETNDVFRCLILHGFDIDLDEIRDIYCPLSRRNQADICVNVIHDLDFKDNIKENLTFYLKNDLDKCTDEEWEEEKEAIEQDMLDYIDDWMSYDELSESDMMELLPFLMTGDMDEFDRIMDEKKKKNKENKKDKKDEMDNKIIHIPLPTEIQKSEKRLEEVQDEEYENVITCSYEHNSLIALSKIDDDFYVIEDDDYEIALNLDQMLFLIESFNRIKDKPVKNN